MNTKNRSKPAVSAAIRLATRQRRDYFSTICRKMGISAASLGFLAFLGGCVDGQQAATPVEEPVRLAKLIKVAAQSDERSLSFPAVVEPSATAVLTFPVPGTLVEMSVVEGQDIKKGDTVAMLDQSNFKAQLDSARTQFNNAKIEFGRAERLLTQGAIPKTTFESRKVAMAVARSTLLQAKKALSDTVMRAPFDGVVARKHTKKFQNVGPETLIATVQTTGAAEAVIQVPARLMARAESMEIIKPFITLDAVPDLELPATLHSNTASANDRSQTFEVRFAFEPPPGFLVLPGMTGTVQARIRDTAIDDQAPKVTVPIGSILKDGSQTYVWLVDEETMMVHRTPIKIEEDFGESLAISEGLKNGDTIVAAGAPYLFEGSKVRPYQP